VKTMCKPSSHANLYHATMRSPSFGLLSRNQITRLHLRERAGVASSARRANIEEIVPVCVSTPKHCPE